MCGIKIICWALLFILKLRFPPGVSIATIKITRCCLILLGLSIQLFVLSIKSIKQVMQYCLKQFSNLYFNRFCLYMFDVVNYTQFIFICAVLASKIKSDPELGIEYFRHDFKKSIKEISTYFRYWNHD